MKLKDLPLTLLFILIGIILFPLILIYSPIAWIKNKQFEKEFKAYLMEIDGKNFFCYNNRKKGIDFIKNEVLPFLPKEVEPIFLNGRKIESGNYNSRFISKAFYSFKNYNRFPQLLKIRNGETIDVSLNQELFSCINQGKDKQLILNKIEDFFELKKL